MLVGASTLTYESSSKFFKPQLFAIWLSWIFILKQFFWAYNIFKHLLICTFLTSQFFSIINKHLMTFTSPKKILHLVYRHSLVDSLSWMSWTKCGILNYKNIVTHSVGLFQTSHKVVNFSSKSSIPKLKLVS